MELLQTFEYDDIKVQTYYNGSDKLPNKVYLNGELVEEDKTFRPSPLHCIDDTETMVSLLAFLVVTSNDVEPEFFETRDSDKLLKWAEESEPADDIKMMLHDYEGKDDKDYLSENDMTREECTRIEQYITSN